MFDEQAPRYDQRVGLPPTAGLAVARAIVDAANAAPDEVVAELGAGTGEIGVHLARLPVRYVGLDSSLAMLAVFRAKAGSTAPPLVVADCNDPWPLADGSATVVFASRVIHLLDPEHVVRETLRVCRSAGYLILGRVQREPESLKERLRHRRQELLLEAGIIARQGEAGGRKVIERCLIAGGQSLGRRVAATWTGETTAAQVIAGWETLSRMGSVAVDADVRARILNALRAWAQGELGDLHRAETFRERYVLDIVRLP
jgi:SAM-dependent methyltransferase